MNFIISHKPALRADETRSARREVKHVPLPEQTIGSVFIEDYATVDLGGDLERNSTWDIRFDHAGDYIRAWGLSGDNQMNASRARHLRDARDRRLDVRRRGLHQIRQLIDDNNHVGNFFGNDQLIVARYFHSSVRCLSGPSRIL